MAIYMKLGGVPGNSTHKNYPQWITLASIHWGLHVDVQTTVGASGNRLSAGKITPSDVSFQKGFDIASVPLMKLAFAGNAIDQATIAITQQASDSGEAYLTYTLFDVIISSFQVAAADSGSPLDSISLNFAKLEVKANPTDEKGKPQQSVGGYDFTMANPI